MNTPKDQISTTWPTIFELASTIPQIDLVTLRGGKNRPPVTQNLIPVEFPVKEGYFEASSEQLASVIVPKVEVTNEVRGFQREKVNSHARKIAQAMLAGEEMPPVMLSIFPDDKAYVDDGQHRLLASMITRKPLEVVVKRRTVEQARKIFAAQSRAKTLRRDDTLLTGDSPLELYIQDALTSDDHPWSALVGVRATRYRMSPTTMAASAGAFGFNSLAMSINDFLRRPEKEFDTQKAASMADLIHAFGSKTTNPVAFRGGVIRAITLTAVHVFQRNGREATPKDYARWMTHMPQFDFNKYPHLLSKESQLSMVMLDHWNKRLPASRKVTPVSYES